MRRRNFVASVLAGGLVAPVAAAGRDDEHEHDHQPLDGPLANATTTFGSWNSNAQPPLDRFAASPITANVHKVLPAETKIKAGGSVNFVISGFHILLVYADTSYDDLLTAVGPSNLPPNPGTTAPIPGGPPVPMVNISTNRVYRGNNPATL